MDTATARVEPEILDLLQTLQPVPVDQFRLLLDCPACQNFLGLPATEASNRDLRDHVVTDHADLVII